MLPANGSVLLVVIFIQTNNMKLPKTLLSAILIGITVQTAVSCTKAKETPGAKAKSENKPKTEQVIDSCIACGMG